jgi:DNA (cytosine-5)-methyltransferase 1
VTRPILLDLFCGQGGAGMGYHRAGFNVVGVDIEPQPRFPFEFMAHDAMELLNDMADYGPQQVLGDAYGEIAAIHASPPCKPFTRTGWSYRFGYHARHEDLLTPTRALLQEIKLPWVIENVPGAPMRPDLELCGCMFGLEELERKRWFEFWRPAFELRQPCDHSKGVVSPRGNTHYKGEADDWARAMSIDWMNAAGLSQAIPPAYTEHIGLALMEYLDHAQDMPSQELQTAALRTRSVPEALPSVAEARKASSGGGSQ